MSHFVLLLGAGLVTAALWAVGSALGDNRVLWPFGIAFGAFVSVPFKWGFYSLCLRAVQGRRVDAADLLAVRDNYREIVIAGVLCTLMVIAGLVLLVVPGVFLYCRLQFVPYLVVDEGMDAVAAIEESFRLTRGLEATIFGIVLVGLAASGVGLLMAGLGLIPALIWWDLAMASLYHAEVLPPGLSDRDLFAELYPA